MPSGMFIRNKRGRRGRKSRPLRGAFSRRKRAALTKKMYQVANRVVMSRAEPKAVQGYGAKTEVYHNTINLWRINDAAYMPTMGTGDNQRIGDQIKATGFKVRMVLGQKNDRPNVTWKFWVVKVPKGSIYAYNKWFKAYTNNVLLDPVNLDFVKLKSSWTWKPYTGYIHGGVAGEITYPYTQYIPYKRLIKFGPEDGVNGHNDEDLYILGAAYDTYGTLITDNIGFVDISTVLHYRDP